MRTEIVPGVRILEDEGELWLSAKDLMESLGYTGLNSLTYFLKDSYPIKRGLRAINENTMYEWLQHLSNRDKTKGHIKAVQILGKLKEKEDENTISGGHIGP